MEKKNKVHTIEKVIKTGKLLKRTLQVLEIFSIILSVLCIRFFLYYMWLGSDLMDALFKDIGLSDYLAIGIITPLHFYFEKIIFENWLVNIIRNRVLPFNTLFEEMVLCRLVDTPLDFRKIIKRAHKSGKLDSDTANEAQHASQLIEKPKPIKTSGRSIIGYNHKLDIVYISLIILLTVGITWYTFLGIFIWVPAIIGLVILVNRLHRYGKISWLEISSEGVFFGEYSQLVTWEQIARICVKKQTSSRYVVSPYVLFFYYDNGEKYECDIRAYNGGWRRTYRAIKNYSPVPVDIDVIND